jgi:hypothetical protein
MRSGGKIATLKRTPTAEEMQRFEKDKFAEINCRIQHEFLIAGSA